MTARLRTPSGEMVLRRVQAQALMELEEQRGLFGPMGVGTGKTIVTLLAAAMVNAQRPLLLLPAALVEKTQRERMTLMKHWRIPTSTQVISYQILGRESAKDLLELKHPDLIVCDEVHRLKNKRAAVTRRVARYMQDHPETMFVGLSGTVIKNSLRDFAHILRWCLGADHAPVPKTEGELEEWADALDEKVQPLQRVRPGALVQLAVSADDEGENELSTSRRAFRRRLIETPGVVASLNTEGVDSSLSIVGKVYEVSSATDANFDRLRDMWETPDGWALSEAVEVWRHAKQLALGLHYEWSPRPPPEWLTARRVWASFVRDILSSSKSLDSEKQVRTAVEQGALDDGGVLAAWKAIEPTFRINPVAVWHDDSALDLCAAWMRREKGIVWVEHTFFGRELARRTGAPYFGQNARDDNGREIEDASVKGPVIASMAACGTGKNLQDKWHTNLFTACPSGGDLLEQVIARTHRPGQQEDEVSADIMIGCIEHLASWESASAEARMHSDMLPWTSKVLLADVIMPSRDELLAMPGKRWRKSAVSSND